MIAYIIQPQVVFVKRFPKNDRYNRCGRAVRQPHVYKYILQARIFRLSMVKDTSRREDAARQGACEIRAHYGGPAGRARQTGACRRAGRAGAANRRMSAGRPGRRGKPAYVGGPAGRARQTGACRRARPGGRGKPAHVGERGRAGAARPAHVGGPAGLARQDRRMSAGRPDWRGKPAHVGERGRAGAGAALCKKTAPALNNRGRCVPGAASVRVRRLFPRAEKRTCIGQAFAVFGGKFALERGVPVHAHAGRPLCKRHGCAQG